MTKSYVLAALKQSRGYVSGEKISKKLNISRSAVNKAVKALRADGYVILSSTRKGYHLISDLDMLNKGELLALLGTSASNRIIHLDIVDSTNAYIRRNFEKFSSNTVVIANEQTNGKGRLGRKFISHKDKGLYLSMLLSTEFSAESAANITAFTAAAVSQAIDEAIGVAPSIKWVNDLIVNEKKVCGILTEMSVEGESKNVRYIIIGIGINCNQEIHDFPDDIKNKASSLFIESGKKVNRASLAAKIINSLDKMVKDFPKNKTKYLSYYRENCITLGREVKVISSKGEFLGTAEKLDDDFGLVVRLSDGKLISVTSGEVSVRGAFGYL
ncbi:MAG TPA: biotin--[acetyl-CoA-carboxylase] ligase [Oscillospiraceae bacterium]|nr:biotin--[acetyl-CoA-carboxylase] ligase [Oscillospiraceae bacterium]